MQLSVPPHLVDLYERVDRFVTSHIVSADSELRDGDRDRLQALRDLARQEGVWALPVPRELGGQGLSLADYAYLADIETRNEYSSAVLGTSSLLDVMTLHRWATDEAKSRFLAPLVRGELTPCYGMTEPHTSGSDISQIRSAARRDGDGWIISGRKWFCRARGADFMIIMCRTRGLGVASRTAFSMFVVPTSAPGFTIVRDLPVLGMLDGHAEVELHDVRIPAGNLLGTEGEGYAIAQQRLSLGRLLRCMQWLGQAREAFELMCRRLHQRRAFNELLADKQLMRQHVFESYVELKSARALVLHAAAMLDGGETHGDLLTEVSTAKVATSRMFSDVTDRAVQVFGAEGLTDDTPLSRLFRAARSTRIYDGPDELHVQAVARRILETSQGSGLFAGVPVTDQIAFGEQAPVSIKSA